MKMDQFDSGRTRAYLLIKAINPRYVADKIYQKWGDQGDKQYVVNRADVVYGEFNVIVPVDTISEDKLRDVESMIKGVRGVNSITIAKVSQHYPALTYLAHGFVSKQEEEYAKTREDLPGPDEEHGRRRKNSPGDNPWG